MKSYDVYLFDFDGTLFDTLDSLVGVYKTALRSVGYDCTKEDAAKYMHFCISTTQPPETSFLRRHPRLLTTPSTSR